MKKSDELKLTLNERIAEAEKLQAEGKIEEATKVAETLKGLRNEIDLALSLEETKRKTLVKEANPITMTPVGTDEATLRNRALNKLVLNPMRNFPQPLTDEERNAYFNVSGTPGSPGQIESVPSRGGYLVSPEQIKTLQEFRQAYAALKPYVRVVQTNTTSGRWPVKPVQYLNFRPFSELTAIAESEIAFTEANYTVSDRGLIIPISNQLLDDADIDIISVIGRDLALAAVRAENEQILTPLINLLTNATVITTHKALNTALFRTLDGTYEPSAKIYTNQDIFLWLSNLEDAQNRPLMVPDVTEPNKYRYRGKEIVVLPNLTLGNTASGSDTYAPIFIGDMKAYMTLFERKGLELSSSSEYLWEKYGYAIRAVIRFGVVVTDPNAMIALKVKL